MKKKQFELFVFYLYFIENGIVLHQGDLINIINNSDREQRGGEAGLRSVIVVSQPAVAEDVGERDSVRLLHPQASRDQVPAGSRDMIAELQLSTADLLVPLEGDVATDHVEEEDPQGPDGGAVPMVLVERDPLRRGVDSGPFNVPF